ncbi:MAG: radical SAM protein [Anaerolineaceae bacterium]
MANLILTNECNQRCSYCFANSRIHTETEFLSYISEQSFKKYLDYLDRSGIDQVRFLGGEPSLHPKFPNFVQEAIEHGKNIIVFSNGLMPDSALNSILENPIDRVKVLVNVTPASDHPSMGYLVQRQYETLALLGRRAHLGYTVYKSDTTGLSFLPEIIEKTNCDRSVRIGLSHPAPTKNMALSPKYYRQAAKGIMKFIRLANQSGVTVEFDCGFVRCMFLNDEIEELRQTKTNFGWRCNPVIDIIHDESAFPCFPLSQDYQIKDALNETENYLVEVFQQETAYLRVLGIFPECSTCTVRLSEGCSGGCLATAMGRLHKQAFNYLLPVPV